MAMGFTLAWADQLKNVYCRLRATTSSAVNRRVGVTVMRTSVCGAPITPQPDTQWHPTGHAIGRFVPAALRPLGFPLPPGPDEGLSRWLTARSRAAHLSAKKGH
jgi:hypothetical protein